jgi:hypothetical protein
MSANLEKIVVGANLFEMQHLLPDLGQLRLEAGQAGDELGSLDISVVD